MLRLLILTAVTNVIKSDSTAAVMSLQAMDFEVFGRVQGVFFRKHTKQQADKLGLRGWCKNTEQGTVLGHMQGPSDKVESIKMGACAKKGYLEILTRSKIIRVKSRPTVSWLSPKKVKYLCRMHWLKTTGSPSSKIEKAEFRNQKEITQYTFDDFGIVKD